MPLVFDPYKIKHSLDNKPQNFLMKITSFFTRSSSNFESKVFEFMNKAENLVHYENLNQKSAFANYTEFAVMTVLEGSSRYRRPTNDAVVEIAKKSFDERNIKRCCDLLDRKEKYYSHEEKVFLKEFLVQFKNPSPDLLDHLNKFDNKKYEVNKESFGKLKVFAEQVEKFYKNKDGYETSLLKLDEGLDALNGKRKIDDANKVTPKEYFQLVELVDDSIKCYGTDSTPVAEFLNIIGEGEAFKEMKKVRDEAEQVLKKVGDEFQKEVKGVVHNGNILQTIVDKESKVIPGLHDKDTFKDKIYFFFKNLLTKHGHSALLVHDKKDGKVHLSHITDHYRKNELKFHHLLYSDVYSVDFKNSKQQKLYENVQENLYDAFSDGIVSKNSDSRKIMSGVYKILYNVASFLKVFRKADVKDEAIERAYIGKLNKDAPKKSNEMFCSEFVAESINVAVKEINDHEKRELGGSKEGAEKASHLMHFIQGSNAKELPPQELIEKLKKEGKVRVVLTENKQKERKIPLFQIMNLENERSNGAAHSNARGG